MRCKTKERESGRAEKPSIAVGARHVVLLCCSAVLLFASTPAQASWVDRLLGLDAISLLDESTHFAFGHTQPAWLWALVILLAVGFSAWSYHHLLGSRSVRGFLALLRGLLVVLVVVLLCKPEIVRRDEKVEQDWLLVLIDRSSSMQVRDTPAPAPAPAPGSVAGDSDEAGPKRSEGPDAPPISRDEALLAALRDQSEVFGDQRLGKDRKIHTLGFGGRTFELAPPWGGLEVKPAEDPATAVRTAIEQALQEAAGHPISGIVLMTDGQSPQSTGSELVHRLEQHAVSVFAVPVGSQTLPLDLAVSRVDAPQRAFINDAVPVGVVVDRIGGGDQEVRTQDVFVRLIDADTGAVLDEVSLADKSFGQEVRLKARSGVVGPTKWRVEVEHRAAGGGAGKTELLTANNVRTMSVEMIDRPIRVLYVEGYPRWEYRYLKNMLLREKSIDSSMLLLTADRAFAQEGDTPITRAPNTPEELRPYDVIILGDVPAGYFSARQIALLKDHVSGGGAGLMWIGGERHVPLDYAATPLADLLPMRRPAAVARLNPDLGEVDLLPTPAAQQLAVLELRGPDVENGVLRDLARYGSRVPDDWPRGLPPLQWAQDLGPLKPTAEVLAHWPVPTGGATEDSAATQPLLVRLRYGAGQSVYVGTDETWRWRYGRGEMYFEQFWIQLVRMLGRDRVQQSGQRARLVVADRRLAQGEATVVSLTLDDPALIARDLNKVTVDVYDGTGPEADPIDRIELRPVTETEADPELGDTRVRQSFRATWRARYAGRLDLRVSEGALADVDLRQPVEVIAPDDEWRRPQADHARLVALAEQTGGAVVPLNELARLEDLVPNRARRTPDDLREPIWNSTLALVVVIGLITIEWIIRKVIRLV